jgi:dTDP-4-amino-4,6-dideoxygalactose transaminase
VLDDAAQSFGAAYKGRKLGTFGLATATSFFPAKPLGCYGDGGAIFTDDAVSQSACAAFGFTGRAPRNTTTSASAHRATGHHAGRDPDREAEDFR